jgi:hypothetical protein
VRRQLEAPELYTTADGARTAARLGGELDAARGVLEAAYARWERATAEAEQHA